MKVVCPNITLTFSKDVAVIEIIQSPSTFLSTPTRAQPIMTRTMHHFALLILLLGATISLAAVVPSIDHRSTVNTPSRRDSHSENLPWYLSHIVAYTAYANSTRNSSISFNLHDDNIGLQLNTTCGITFGKGVEPDTGGRWAQCQNSAVRFRYTAGAIGIQRTWKDDR